MTAPRGYQVNCTGPSTAEESFTSPVLLQDVTVNEHPFPGVVGSVLLAVNVTTPSVTPLFPVLVLPAVMGQRLVVSTDLQLPATDTRPTLAPV